MQTVSQLFKREIIKLNYPTNQGMRNRIPFLFLFVSFTYQLSGQNLESLGTEKPLKINGGLSFNQIFYDAVGVHSGRSPYTYYLAGNINLSIYGWSVPFSYFYSNQQSSFQQPFNQYGLHPTYKWITAHIGYASMTFSPYTLSGHQFLGAGVELNPGKIFKFSAMYGRLQKGVNFDSTNTNAQPAYKRIGYGLKAGMTLNRITMEVMAFHSKDDANSINNRYDSLQQVYPEENFAIGANTSVSIFEKLKFQVEYGTSMITRDTRSAVSSENIFFSTHTSTERYEAVKAGLKYSESFYSAGVNYERIDPGYRTHGSYYFNNDMENITGNLTAGLFKKKLNLGANIGVQRDDLNNKKMSSMVRMVNSFNLGYAPGTKLNISATYSNFTSHTNVKSQFENINQLTPYENLDTLNFTQISNNGSLNVNYTVSTTEKSRQFLSFNTTYQKASEYQDQVLTNSGATFLNLNLAHNYTFTKTNTSFTTSINYSNCSSPTLKSYTIGPTLSVRKNLFKNKLRSSLSASYNNSYSNGSLISSVTNLRANTGYSLKKKHNFNLTGGWINRKVKTTSDNETTNKTFTEFTITLGYSYNF